jgi:predicted hotdog family 3-hydroxylacyl-ACP dehydratase
MKGEKPPEIEAMIPHRSPMRLIDNVLELDEDPIETLSIVNKSWPLCDEQGADVILSIEIIAQSVAALYHRRKRRAGAPQIDFLVGIKEARFLTLVLPLNEEIKANVKMVSFIGNYGIFKGEVSIDGEIICQAVVQVLEPGEELWAAIISGRAREVRADD